MPVAGGSRPLEEGCDRRKGTVRVAPGGAKRPADTITCPSDRGIAYKANTYE